MFEWLTGGNDQKTASTTYSGRESATDRKARKEREGRAAQALKENRRRSNAVAAADRAGRATHQAGERRRFGGW
ncbi:hypothetical protein [Kitasatospora aureofaciens]|uniref:hypothetical protein n=1 Tax=Kitasatospora aureofaciens TaxID=1894 RepID=UPI0033DDC566